MREDLEVKCSVCGRRRGIAEVVVFMGCYVCRDCTVEDLLRTHRVACTACGRRVRLQDACEHKGGYFCRRCGIEFLCGGKIPRGGSLGGRLARRFLRWFT